MSPRSLHRPSPAGASAPPAAAPSPLSEYLVAREPGRRERAENWRVAIGLQKVDGLEVSPYLVETARRNIEGAPFAEHAWFFRNALVRANYEDLAHGIERTTAPLEAFFRNILLGERNELKNRYLHIRAKELGLVAPLGAPKPDVTINVTINDTIKLTDIERKIAEILRKTPTTTRAELSVESGLSSRQIQRILDSLKTKMGLRRVGSRKTGRWEFPPHPAT